MKKGDWFITSSGRQVWPLSLDPSDIHLQDIAHSLSNLCRFGGHCKFFYSVAQHSVLVSEMLDHDLELARIGLLHDATEAYCGDVIRPLKRNLVGYKEIEDSIWRAVATKFNLPLELPHEVVMSDCRMLLTEKRDILASLQQVEWTLAQAEFPSSDPYPISIEHGWSPDMAQDWFLTRATELSIK